MNQLKRRALLKELLRRKKLKPNWFDPNFYKQNDFVLSPAKLKVVQCTRRAGKSYGAGLYLFKEAYENPGVSVVYMGLTRESAKRIMFDTVLKEIDHEHKINARFNSSDLSIKLPNGSAIHLIGVDKDADQMNKLLGQKFKLAIIDEAAFFRQDLYELVHNVLEPAMADDEGTICMLSTTSNLLNSYYHKATDRQAGHDWEVFKWTTADNPFMKDKIKIQTDRMIKSNPLIKETAHYRRMYLNEWVIEADAIIYKYDEARNTQDIFPQGKLNYVLGIDLGYNDASAFVVCAYSQHDPNLYIIETFKKSEMIIEDVANKIKELDKKYNFTVKVVDNASKQAVEEMKQRHNLALIPAEKSNKRDFIEQMNSDLIIGRIKLTSKAEDLREEWLHLVWDEKKLKEGKYTEHPKCENHLSDAALYAWRWCSNYAWTKKQAKVDPRSEEAMDIYFAKAESDIMRATTPEEYVPYEEGENEWL